MPDSIDGISVAVVGAGAAGLSAALEIADRGHKVQLFDRSTLGSGTSGSNPSRHGHGHHYIDIETAIMYLRESIRVQRKYKRYIVGAGLPYSNELQHGRYFITKDSDNSPEEILDTYKELKKEYIRLINEDSENEVFGSPEDFYRILNPEEYAGIVNSDIVKMGIETTEHLFDWKAFVTDIKAQIIAHKNITLYENTEILGIQRGDLGNSRFTLRAKAENQVETLFHTDYLVNSTWQNIEEFNEQVGLTMVPGSRTNRLKAVLIAKLPESLVQANSMFFCMGQHCMFSNMGNGYGMMTYASVTNMETSTDLKISEKATRLITGGATSEEKNEIGRNILAGVAKYIPAMADATVVDVKFGIVQTAGELTLSDLKDVKSNFHKRDYDGIREEQVGWISNPCMKLFYFVRNGKVVADMLDASVIASKQISTIWMPHIIIQAKTAGINLITDLKKAILAHIERYTSSTKAIELPNQNISTSLFQAMKDKKAALDKLKEKVKANTSYQPLATPKQDTPTRVIKDSTPSQTTHSLQTLGISSSLFIQMICNDSTKMLAAVFLVAGITGFILGILGGSIPVVLVAVATAGTSFLSLRDGFFSMKNTTRGLPSISDYANPCTTNYSGCMSGL